MLDQELKEQLRTVFAPLGKEISLIYKNTQHPDQQQLLDLISGFTECSGRVKIIAEGDSQSQIPPQFSISVNGQKNGIHFSGIPTGHEFTSLILAILNSDLKGKMPDEALTRRIRNLKGPIRIKTYISLTCENCPDVVQALNQMAILHPDFEHEMIDGGYFQEDIERLHIQGVPSIVVGNQLIHSGRIGFVDLIAKLESHFGMQSSPSSNSEIDLGQFDVVVVGGGPAGASAAIYSVRKGLKTAVLAERLGGQVQDTRGIENLISVPYTEGPQLAAQLNKHMAEYPIQVFENRRVEKVDLEVSSDKYRNIYLTGGEKIQTQSLIVATGAKWKELNVSGEKEYIGRGVAFCPHCDGPYYKGKKIAVIGGGNSGVEAAIDLAGIVKEVVVFEYNSELKADQVLVKKLMSLPNVQVVTSAQTQSIDGDGQKVVGLTYLDRSTHRIEKVSLEGVFVQIGLVPNSQFLKEVVPLSRYGEIIIDEKGRTQVPGIYAAGDVTTVPYKQIIIAMGEGAKAGLAAFEDRMVSHN